MTAMAGKMSEAGLDTDKARLDRVACEELRKAKQNRTLATRRFLAIVFADAGLAVALAGKSVLELQGEAYINQRSDDMRPKRDVVSRKPSDSQTRFDRHVPAPTNSRSSQTSFDSHGPNDRPAPTRGGVSHLTNESQTGLDRPSPSSKAVKPLYKAAANKALLDPVYQARISKHIDFCIADISHYHYLNLDIALAGPLAVKMELEDEAFPDMNTPIKDFLTLKRLKKIVAAAEKAESAALSNAKSVRSMLEHRP